MDKLGTLGFCINGPAMLVHYLIHLVAIFYYGGDAIDGHRSCIAINR